MKKNGFSGYYVDQPEWSGGFLKRVRIAEEEREDSSNIMLSTYIGSSTEAPITSKNVEDMTLKEMLMHDQYIELTFGILRKIAKASREELIGDLIHKDMHVNREKKIYESTAILDQLQDRVLKEMYAENIMMGSGWVFFEPEGDDTYASVTSTWKVSDETRAQWDAEEREEERAYKEWYDGLSDKERAKYESEEEDEMELV